MKYLCVRTLWRWPLPGADPENVEPGGANSVNYQTEPGGATLFFCLTYKAKQGGVRRVRPPLNPRLPPPLWRHALPQTPLPGAAK